MTNTPSLPSRSQNKSFWIFLTATVLLCIFMGYVDEGYYDFRWMKDPGNWIAFGIYGLCMLVGQLVFFNIFLRRYKGVGKIAISAIFGSILGAGILMALFFLKLSL